MTFIFKIRGEAETFNLTVEEPRVWLLRKLSPESTSVAFAEGALDDLQRPIDTFNLSFVFKSEDRSLLEQVAADVERLRQNPEARLLVGGKPVPASYRQGLKIDTIPCTLSSTFSMLWCPGVGLPEALLDEDSIPGIEVEVRVGPSVLVEASRVRVLRIRSTGLGLPPLSKFRVLSTTAAEPQLLSVDASFSQADWEQLKPADITLVARVGSKVVANLQILDLKYPLGQSAGLQVHFKVTPANVLAMIRASAKVQPTSIEYSL